MIPDVIDAELAQRIHNKILLEGRGDSWIWKVLRDHPDFPDQFVARPFSRRSPDSGLRSFLVSNTLEGLRAQLPWGLTWIGRKEEDPINLVETWI